MGQAYALQFQKIGKIKKEAHQLSYVTNEYKQLRIVS